MFDRNLEGKKGNLRKRSRRSGTSARRLERGGEGRVYGIYTGSPNRDTGSFGIFSAHDELLSFPTGFLSVRNGRFQRETGHGKRIRTCDGRETVETGGEGGAREGCRRRTTGVEIVAQRGRRWRMVKIGRRFGGDLFPRRIRRCSLSQFRVISGPEI